MKKAISAATSAALLASLLATAVAPGALAAVTTAGVGNVGRASTSTATATFTLSEERVGCINGVVNANGGEADLFIQILPKAPVAGSVQFVGTPTLVAPGSLGGATATLVQFGLFLNDTIRIRIFGGDTINKQQIIVSGLKVKASAGATLGAIQTLLFDDTTVPGDLAGCFIGATETASGTVSAGIGIGATSVTIAVSSGTFAVTAGTSPDKLVFATGESVNVTAAGAVVAGLQTLTIAATTAVHNANEAVTQANVPSTIDVPFKMGSVGTVTDSVRQDVWLHAGGLPIPSGDPQPFAAGSSTAQPLNVNPGEQNQDTLSTYVYERNGIDATTGSAGFIAKNTVLTFTLDPASGVLFSTSPSVQALDAATGRPYTFADNLIALKLDGAQAPIDPALGGVPRATDGSTVCTISFDRKSCSIKVTQASTNSLHPAAVSLYNISVDVDAAVAKGTPVNINVTGVPVVVDFQTVAFVSRIVVGVAAQPTIFINYNDQASGMMTLNESGAGFFQDASVTLGNNVFAMCVTSGETFTRAPWAVVATGDLKLLSGLVGATSVQGTLFTNSAGNSCAKWTVFSASTVASTIDIRGSDSANVVLPAGANNGPRYSVGPNLAPGSTNVSILIGSDANVTAMASGTIASLVSNAIRVFKSGVTVTALSQPFIPQGTADSLGGNIQITETLAGQFKAGEEICVGILPRTSNNLRTQDTFLKTATTNDLPIITTNAATGLLVSSVGVFGCDFQDGENTFTTTNSFHFTISQQAFGTLGQITVSNIHYITTADAPLGPVLVSVDGFRPGVDFQTIVSNAKIGTAAVLPKLGIGAVSALGLKPTTGYTTKTPKTQVVRKYITWKFTGGQTLAGQRVNVMVAKKVNGAWGGPKYLKSAVADANGIVTFAWRFTSAAAINVRVQWPGSATFGVSTSKALGGYWK